MIDPAVKALLQTAFTYALCGMLVAVVLRYRNRKEPGPRLDQAAAVGFLIGGAFGALMGIFRTMMTV